MNNRPKYSSVEALLADKSRVSPSTGCVEWLAGTEHGYGRFGRGGRNFYAHREAYRVAKGDIPGGMLVCHTCDNRLCINPEHLWLGTTEDNCADRDAKMRQSRGDAHPSAKVTDEQVMRAFLEIRDGKTFGSAARGLGVSDSLLFQIHKGVTRKYLQDDIRKIFGR